MKRPFPPSNKPGDGQRNVELFYIKNETKGGGKERRKRLELGPGVNVQFYQFYIFQTAEKTKRARFSHQQTLNMDLCFLRNCPKILEKYMSKKELIPSVSVDQETELEISFTMG